MAIKKIGGGVFLTSWANDSLKAGDSIEVMTPEAVSIPSSIRQSARHYVAFAAGSGITPVIAHQDHPQGRANSRFHADLRQSPPEQRDLRRGA